ncbi:unnamed protein product, partial [Didymodactylos carnosus]
SFDAKELIRYFKNHGIAVGPEEAKQLINKIDSDGSLEISWDEWRSYFLMNLYVLDISDDAQEMLGHWRSVTHVMNVVVDDSLFIPPYIPNDAWFPMFVATGIAGAFAKTLTAPFDRMKTVMQYLGSQEQIGLIDGYKYLIKEGGMESLWRGNGMSILKCMPDYVGKFTAFEQIKILLNRIHGKDEKSDLKGIERYLAGSAAGIIGITSTYPLDVLRIRLILRRSGEFTGIFDAVKKIYRNEGLRAFGRGYPLSLFYIMPASGINFGLYEVPLSKVNDVTEHARVRHMVADIWRNEGIVGFYRGFVPNILKYVPGVTIAYVIYESVKERMSKKEARQTS